MRLFVAAIRFQLSGRTSESRAAVQEILQSNFRDPEGVFYLTLLLPRLGQVDLAEMLLGKAVEGGFHCTRRCVTCRGSNRCARGRRSRISSRARKNASARTPKRSSRKAAHRFLDMRAGRASSDPGWPSASSTRLRGLIQSPHASNSVSAKRPAPSTH